MIRELFNIPVVKRPPPGAPHTLPPPGTPPPQREGAFVTTQSLVSFAGATSAVTVIANVVGQIVPKWTGPILIAVLSALVGLTIYLISETDPLRNTATVRERIIAGVIALINTCVIFSASIGASSFVPDGAAAAPNTPPAETNHVGP